MNPIGTLGAFVFAALGRWFQLHPEKIPIQGTFEGPQSSGAIAFRQVVAVLGTFAVFIGVLFGIYSLSLWSDSSLLHAIVLVFGTAAGVFAARRVREEVRSKYQPIAGQFGLWP